MAKGEPTGAGSGDPQEKSFPGQEQGYDDGKKRSMELRKEFLDSVPEEKREFLFNAAEKLFTSVEEIWKNFGHKVKWINEAHLDTNRNVNDPEDKSCYVRRDAKCENCENEIWFTVNEGETTIYGGHHQCHKD